MQLLSITGFAQQPAGKIIGKWESADGDVKLHFDTPKQDGKKVRMNYTLEGIWESRCWARQ